MTPKNFIDLLLIVAWAYINGYIFALLIAPLGLNPHRTGSFFAFLAWLVGVWSVIHSRKHGRIQRGRGTRHRWLGKEAAGDE